ncbi:uncharacterized protein mav isoform X1 [Drosophila pseudoobscura]|uniref:Uncharacterized protein mav isoform X1 n=2 Tax=Drosophila pseudoobscura pseudoobscura TaxID=46245 RepID=A0A6I8UA91_DROPS|nr:uncharacterized protein LOC4811687 isoform X1 [Drosophila pseudoobscura]
MIIESKPNFPAKYQKSPKRCNLYKCVTVSRDTKNGFEFRHMRRLHLCYIWILCHCYYCYTTNKISAKRQRAAYTFISASSINQIRSKLAIVHTRTFPTKFLKYSLYNLTQVWLVILFLLLFMVLQANGQGIFGPMSKSNVNDNPHTLQEFRQQDSVEISYDYRSMQFQSSNGRAQSRQTNQQLQKTTQTKSKNIKNKINNIFNQQNNIQSRGGESSLNESSNKYSLIILSPETQSNNVNNSAMEVKKNNSIPIQNIRKRYIRNTGKETEAHNYTKNYNYKALNGNRIDESKLKRLVMNGLGLKKIPDMRKVNISQVEYSRKYVEYLDRLRTSHGRGVSYLSNESGESSRTDLHILSIVTNSFNDISEKRWRHKRSVKNGLRQTKRGKSNENIQFDPRDKTNILLHFPLTNVNDANFHHDKIDEANVRLMLLYSSALATNSGQRQTTGKKRKFNRNFGSANKNNKNCNAGDVIDFNPEQRNESKMRGRVHSRKLNLKVYQLLSSNRRRLLASRKIEFENIHYEETRTQWLEFDVTKAVRGWLNKTHENLGIEIQCDRCRSIGARILSDVSSPTPFKSASAKSAATDSDRFHLMPVLNIIGHGNMQSHREGDLGVGVQHLVVTNNRSDNYFHHRSDQDMGWRREKWNNSCYKVHQRCCRHQLDVIFKEIKGFEFILQPKMFDAGYCHGRCPPRHNPAHHHALLQSLIWQQDSSRAPRPCCAPSKLEVLEILHVDEEHTDKLKISTWSDMQVLECACS